MQCGGRLTALAPGMIPRPHGYGCPTGRAGRPVGWRGDVQLCRTQQAVCRFLKPLGVQDGGVVEVERRGCTHVPVRGLCVG